MTDIIEILQKLTTLDNKTNCWLINEKLDKDGYPYIYIPSLQKTQRANRLSAYVYHNLDLKSDLQANHIRECPNRNCWNPAHIYVGTQSENRLDSFMTGKSGAFGFALNKGKIVKPFCSKGHLKTGKGNRCLECKREHRLKGEWR